MRKTSFLFLLVLSVFFPFNGFAQGLQACLDLQAKNPGVRDPIREIISSDFRCSIPSWTPKIFFMRDDPGEVFYQACVIHDLCYKHGSYSYGINRKSCDEEFKNRMIKICYARFENENQLRCRADVNTLYEVVRALGFAFYLSPPGFNDFPQGIEPFTNDHGRVCRYLDESTDS